MLCGFSSLWPLRLLAALLARLTWPARTLAWGSRPALPPPTSGADGNLVSIVLLTTSRLQKQQKSITFVAFFISNSRKLFFSSSSRERRKTVDQLFFSRLLQKFRNFFSLMDNLPRSWKTVGKWASGLFCGYETFFRHSPDTLTFSVGRFVERSQPNICCPSLR